MNDKKKMPTSSNEDFEPEKWNEVFNKLEKDYKEAYHNIDKAIQLDEDGKLNEALPLYEIGLSLIDKALGLPLNEPPKPDFSWEKAIVMMQKLKKTRKEILIRIDNVKSKPEEPAANELPPPYEEVISSSKSHLFKSDSTNGNTFQLPGPSKTDTDQIPPFALQDKELLPNLHSNEKVNSDACFTYSDLSHQLKKMNLPDYEETLFICDNAQLYFIAPDGKVNLFSEAVILKIARLNDEALPSSERTFLQIGPIIYPLIPELPCIRSDFGAFIFPDINSEVQGAAIGIILPEGLRDEVHKLLTHLLNEASVKGRSRRSVEIDSSTNTYASKIVHGSAYVARNLVTGAGSLARFLDYLTPKIIDKINPNPEPKEISPKIQKIVEVTKVVSGKAFNFSDYLATKIYMTTAALGKYLSPYIQKQGTRILESTTSISEEEATEKINSMANVISDVVQGVSTVINGLDTAAGILSQSLANNTVQIIEYKYGQPLGAITNDALTTFGNFYYTHHNFRVIRPKGIVKAAVKGTGKALLEDYANAYANLKPHEDFQRTGPGDGSGFSAV